MIVHPIPPLFNAESEVLILGSFPSVKSREAAFFYGHPQNRFWAVIAEIFGTEKPVTVEEKKELILSNKLALWDVIAQCEIEGSADSTITDVTANDLSVILENSNVKRIFVNGKTAEKYYNKYTYPKTGIKAVCLPSTSPANAAWNVEKLVEKWKIITADD
ncbi:MAG: DNA-deoxyinosine glycosylase [Acutalibacteraceae bacterium]|nr:DNA-deoxyinosine glycosylase [Acutalibacteraceae bacterium]